MVIDQRNAGASVTITNTSDVTYTLDRWFAFGTVASKFSVEQTITGVSAPVGFTEYLAVTSSSAYPVTSSDSFSLGQSIEGLNVADLGWGTANAQTVTLSFWVRSSLTGTFGGAIRNSAVNRSYPFTYTILSANTWELKSVPIAGDTSGTWLTTNGVGVRVGFGLGQGSTFSGTAGAWASSNLNNATGATSVVGTNGATFYITGIQLEKGSTATSFDYRPIGTELQLAQRYYYQWNSTAYQAGGFLATIYSGTTAFCSVPLPVTMRSSPTLASVTASNFQFLNASLGGHTPTGISLVAANPTDASLSISGSGMTGAQSAILWGANTSAKLQLSAEL